MRLSAPHSRSHFENSHHQPFGPGSLRSNAHVWPNILHNHFIFLSPYYPVVDLQVPDFLQTKAA
jgi:hypothetical protein